MPFRRCFTLIEVLISFMIIVMCILPLLYPHSFILREQSSFLQKIDQDHTVNLLYGKILERLYTKEISFGELTRGQEFGITDDFIRSVGGTPDSRLKGKYFFTVEKSKSNEEKTETAFLIRLTFVFYDRDNPDNKGKTFTYPYKIFVFHTSVNQPETEPNEEGEEEIAS